MHMLFTDEELKWINTREFGFPIKPGCPEKIKESINRKKSIVNNQAYIP